MSEPDSTRPDYGFARDFKGYGENGLELKWPNNAKVAVSFVINYEEGGEQCILDGDASSEANLREFHGMPARKGERDPSAESEYEYGARAGFWRLFRLFNRHGLKFTLYAVARAVERQPEVARRCVEEGHEVASHGYRWVDYHDFPVEEEKEHIRRAITSLKSLTGYAPRGWYYGRPSPRSRALVPQVYAEQGERLCWFSDTYADDVPYWTDPPADTGAGGPAAAAGGLLMLPYSYDANDFKFYASGTGFGDPRGFLEHVRNAFDVLLEEGAEGRPKMMTVGLHCRIAGRPGRFAALRELVEYITAKEGVWVATRSEIAEAFAEQYPYRQGRLA